ncbi:uncharacterized protein LOC121932233 isoform X2 [Sceloporus undulatus]|uniref:uncharacterized protein LOC121932233 isoform X2 n=1 Tax=Sceloporus undulatus TaxID=8520 RepID=UPI001C4D85B0|nr:uncharacterized protein LOC121932233 isoform X2 [Sceloporus undulatus]
MAPKPAAKPPAKPAGPTPAPPPATPQAAPKTFMGRKIKSLPPKMKTMLILSFGSVCFAIFILSTAGYIRLRLAKSNPYVPPLNQLRKALAEGRRNPLIGYKHYVGISDEVRQLPNYLSESKKDLRNRKAKYQSIFKKGRTRSADQWEIFGRNIYYISNVEKTCFSSALSSTTLLGSVLQMKMWKATGNGPMVPE